MHVKLFRYLIWGVLLIGILLRYTEYAVAPSLNYDEVITARKIARVPLSELTHFKKAAYETMHAYPVVFLSLIKWAGRWPVADEYSLRFFPLLFSVLSLFIFASLTKKFLSPPWQISALLLFSLAPTLVASSFRLKPISGDIFFSLMGILILMSLADKDPSPRTKAGLILIGLTAVFSSFTAIFVLAAGTPVVLIWHALERNRRKFLSGLTVGSIWLAGIAFYYLISLRYFKTDPGLKGYWSAYFLPLTDGMIPSLKWLVGIFHFFFRKFLLVSPGLASVLALVGIFQLFRKDRRRGAILSAPVVLMLLLSALKLYPFGDRTTFFLVPVFMLLVVKGVETLRWPKRPGLSRALRLFVMGVVLTPPLLISTRQFMLMPAGEDIRPILRAVNRNRREGDLMAVFYGAGPAYEYYAPRLGLPAENFWIHPYHLKEFRQQIQQRSTPEGPLRVWLIFTHIKHLTLKDTIETNELSYILWELNHGGEKRAEFVITIKPGQTPGYYENNVSAAAYLYEFGSSSP